MATTPVDSDAPRAATRAEPAKPRPTPTSNEDTGIVLTSPKGAGLHERFKVELLQPGEQDEPWRPMLAQLRQNGCLPDKPRNNMARQLATNPVIVGYCNHEEGKSLMGAMYVVPTEQWIATRDELTDHGQYKAHTSLEQAKFLNLVEFDCTPKAVEFRLSTRLVKEAFDLLPEGVADRRFVTHSPVFDLQPFCARLMPENEGDVRFFWNCMKQLAADSSFETLSGLTAELGNMERLVGELLSCDTVGLARLREKHGEPLDRFLVALAKLFALGLFDPHSGDDQCLVSRFHRYHGGKLLETMAGSSLDQVESLGVVFQFEYVPDQIDKNRAKYRDLRRQRRSRPEPKP